MHLSNMRSETITNYPVAGHTTATTTNTVDHDPHGMFISIEQGLGVVDRMLFR
jgi:hypothetical protein